MALWASLTDTPYEVRGELIPIHACQNLSRHIDHVSSRYPSEGSVPVAVVYLGQVTLDHLTHGDSQAGPAEVVVGRRLVLGLHDVLSRQGDSLRERLQVDVVYRILQDDATDVVPPK